MEQIAFDKIYRDVPAERREQLWRFRETHSYKRLAVDGIEWEYIACGEGEQALLFLVGVLGTGETFFQEIIKWEGQYRIISPSYPPIGKMRPLTDGLVGILNAEGIDRVHVLGSSLGAGIGHMLVRQHPEQVEKLVLLSLGLFGERRVSEIKRLVRLFGLLPYWFIRWNYKRQSARMFADLAEADRAFMQAYLVDVLDLQLDKNTLLGQIQLMEDVVVNAPALQVFEPVEGTGKVLIIQAEDDAGSEPDEKAALRATYPGAQVRLFKEGGHLVGMTRRDEIMAMIDDFLKDTGI